MTETDEINAIRRTLDGDPAGFNPLVERWQAPLIRYLGSILTDKRNWAEDLAQDVFLEAYRKLSSFDPQRARFSTWLFLIARSRALNALQKLRPKYVAEPPETGVTDVSSEDLESLRFLDLALAKLPVLQREVFHLVVVEGHSYEEVARVQGVAAGTIKSRVSRARQFLTSSLEERSTQS